MPRAWPSHFPNFVWDHLFLSDFKTGPFSLLARNKCIFFANNLFFWNLLKQLIWYWLHSVKFHKKEHHIIEIQKSKCKTGQYFIQNYLRSKYEHSKSIVKGKFELWKKQTGWRLGFNNENWKTHFIGTFTFIVN